MAKLNNLAVAVAFLSTVAWIVRPQSNNAAIIANISKSYDGMIKAAMGLSGTFEGLTADQYRAEVEKALEEFWEGFDAW